MRPTSEFGPPIDARPLLGPERAALLELLAGLDESTWSASTPCPSWSVHELAVHLIHDDLRRLSAGRDGHRGAWVDVSGLDNLAAALSGLNEAWVTTVAPSMSPRMVRETLAWLAAPTEEHLGGLDPDALGAAISWAGEGRQPNWLDVAREYTERWVHQQQLREAVSRPGLEQPEFVGPVCETFARGVARVLPARTAGTALLVRMHGPVEKAWTWVTAASGWQMTEGASRPAAVVDLPVSAFWRRAVRMMDRPEIAAAARVEGDDELAAAALDLRGAIVVA